MTGKFAGQVLNVINTTVNSYTHTFTLQLPRLTQQVCSRELEVTATGYNATGILAEKTKIFVKNCKYDYCVHLILVLCYF